MPTFRTIDDTEVAVDAPLTQQLMQALKDNLTAVIEDDSTAPSIKRSAISDAIADQKPATAGDVSVGAWKALFATNTTGTVSHASTFIIAVTGRYNIRASVTYSSTRKYKVIVKKNGSDILTVSMDSNGTLKSGTLDDTALNAGDIISITTERIDSNDITDAFATAQCDLGVSVETAAFYNRIGGMSIDFLEDGFKT